ncbi:amidohydrolase family protein [Spirochaetota bacterium]
MKDSKFSAKPVKMLFTDCTVCNPNAVTEKADISIDKNVFTKKNNKNDISVSLAGKFVYPGLINSHDHMLGTYLPRVGHGPYLNWKPWDEDLKNSDLYKERGKLANDDIYLLSVYRQILSGVTTVSDHIPHFINESFIDRSPVRIIRDYALAHECSSYDLNWGDGLEKEIAKAKKKDIPFITHIEEGYDKEALEGITFLNKKKGLFKNSVLIHCISCSKDDIKLIAQKKANFVWCPSSNMFMFNDTADVRNFIKEGVNVTLGTDSPMSGSLNMLEELKIAKKTYKKFYKKEINSKVLFSMVTQNAAKAFKLDEQLGSIENGKYADMMVTKKRSKDAYENLTKIEIKDIELVMRDGIPLYGTADFKDFFEKSKVAYQQMTLNGEDRYMVGDVRGLKKRIDKALKFKKELDFLPI